MIGILTLLAVSISGKNIMYKTDPGNDIAKPKQHASISNEDVVIDFYFEFSADNETVTMMMEIDKTTYFSFGPGTTMSDADLWVFQIEDNVIIATDNYAEKHGKPPLDVENGGTDDIEVLGYYYDQDGKSGIKFKRKIDTGDIHDTKLTQNEEFDFIWAFGKETNTSLANHGKTNRGHVVLNFTSDGTNDDIIIDDEFDFYDFHKWTNVICWGIMSDIAIIIGRYYKTWGLRTYFHGFLFILIVTSSLTTAFMFLNKLWANLEWNNFKEDSIKNQFHIIVFFIFFGFMILQCVGGIIQNIQLNSFKINTKISIKPSYHQIFGSIIYLIGKIQIIIGLCMVTDERVIIIIGIVIIIRVLLEILYQYGFLVNIVMVGSSNQKKSHKKIEDYKDPLLENNINQSEDNFIENQKSKLWCVYQNQIVDLSSLQHPGGNYIWNLIRGQDVSRYIYGAYGLDELKLNPYQHSIYTQKILEQYKTGISVFNVQLFVKNSTNSSLNELKAIWKLNTTNPYTELISYYGFTNQSFKLKNTCIGLDTFGAYFVIKPSLDYSISTRQYTMVQSMAPQRVKYRKEVLELFKKVLSLQLIHNELPKLPEYINELPLIIKKYESNSGFSQFIHTDNTQGEYQIEGPYGKKIEIFDGNHLVFIAGGTGLFPFLDILEYQLRMSYYQILVKSLGIEASKLIDLGLSKIVHFKITIFLAVNSLDDLIGRDIYFALLSLQSRLEEINFSMIIRGQFKLKETPTITQRFSPEVFKSYIKDINSINGFYICGPPQMNKTTKKQLIEDMRINSSIVHIL